MTKYKRNNKTHKSKKDLLTYLDLLLNNYPYNIYDGWSMPTQQMLLNSFWQNPTLGLNLSLNTNLGLGLNSMYNLGLNNTPKLSAPTNSSKSKLIGNSSLTPAYGAAAGMGFDTVDTLLAGGKKTGLGTGAVNAGASLMTSGLSSGNPALILAGGIAGTAGTIYNAAFGSKMNEERITLAENEINAANSFNANASNFDDLFLLIASSPVIAGFRQKDIGSDGWFSNKAKNKYKSLLALKEYAENWVDRSIANATTNLLQLLVDNLLLNYAAYGGLLDMNNQYSDGGKIYIKPENRGKFTALKERTGKSATWFKEHGTPALKKMATFALNARKWKHKDGGILSTHGLDLSNGVTYINNGNTHENNRYEGVLMGVDSEGVPNLVEEGEVIFNNYVFSNRIRVPDAVRNKYKLRGTKDMTFADAAKKAAKESEERPNDPISLRGLEDIMNKLANEQEVMRELRKNKRHNRLYKDGGDLAWDEYKKSLNDYKDDLLPNPITEYWTNPHNQAVAALTPVENIATKKSSKMNSLEDDLIARDNLLRYAPAFGNALGVGYGLLSKPNYSRADALALFAQNAGKITPITYEPIGNYLTYRPTDLSYQANRMAALAGATRRNIMNTSGGNRANAIGSLLAADYNSLIAMGEAIRQAEATNFARRALVEEFNRGTDLYNSELALKAAIANQEARMKASQLGLSGYTTAMKMKDDIDALRNASLSANLTNLFDSLGDIGREEVIKKMVKNNPALLYDYFGRYKGNISAEGGKLNKKKRGGFTY